MGYRNHLGTVAAQLNPHLMVIMDPSFRLYNVPGRAGLSFTVGGRHLEISEAKIGVEVNCRREWRVIARTESIPPSQKTMLQKESLPYR